MKIQYASDLHLELSGNSKYVSEIPFEVIGDVLVLAGDTAYLRDKDLPGQQLLPFTSQQKYNRDIKTMFEKAGLDRIVTIINPKTREEEKKRLCDIASSHLARRTFIGNLYKETPDPNIIGKLSGHKEGSRAFARYRDIDDDMLTDLVSKLN